MNFDEIKKSDPFLCVFRGRDVDNPQLEPDPVPAQEPRQPSLLRRQVKRWKGSRDNFPFCSLPPPPALPGWYFFLWGGGNHLYKEEEKKEMEKKGINNMWEGVSDGVR